MQIVAVETGRWPYYVLLDDEGYPLAQGSRELCEQSLRNLSEPMSKPTNETVLDANFDTRVAQYIKLQDKKTEIKERHKEELKPINDAEELLEAYFMQQLQTMGVSSVKCGHGTVFQKADNSATIADGEAFREFVKANEAWDLTDLRANKVAVREFIEKNGMAPAGVNYSTRIGIGYRRA
jgi:Tfp pilus assembly protein PilP